MQKTLFFSLISLGFALQGLIANAISGAPKLSKIVEDATEGTLDLTQNIYQVDTELLIVKEIHLRKADAIASVEIYFLTDGALTIKDKNFSMRNISLIFQNSRDHSFLISNSDFYMEHVTIERQNISSTIFLATNSNLKFVKTIFSEIFLASASSGFFIDLLNSNMVLNECVLRNCSFIKFSYISLSNSLLFVLGSEFRYLKVLGVDKALIQSTNGITISKTVIDNYDSNKEFLFIDPSPSSISTPLLFYSCLCSKILINSVNQNGLVKVNSQNIIYIKGSTFERLNSNQLVFGFMRLNLLIFADNKFFYNCYSNEMISIQSGVEINFINNLFNVNNDQTQCPFGILGTLIGLTSCYTSNLLLNTFEKTFSNFNVAVLRVTTDYQIPLSYVFINYCSFTNNLIQFTKMNQPGVSISISSSQYMFFVIFGSNFYNNYFDIGNAVERVGGPCIYSLSKLLNLLIASTIFKKNKSRLDCSCIQIENAYALVVTKSLFQNNTIPDSFNWQYFIGGTSGAIHTTSQLNLIIGCSFENNSNYKGAGLYIDGSKSSFITSFSIYNCDFNRNFANYGGGILIGQLLFRFDLSLILATSFRNNKAEFGGGLSLKFDISSANVLIIGCIFTLNQADFGGGIGFQHTNGLGTIISSYFYKNLGKFINGNSVMNDMGGGSAFTINGRSQTRVITMACLFEQNEAKFGGIENLLFIFYPFCYFKSQKLFQKGGAAALITGDYTDIQSTFKGNTAVESAAIVGILYSQMKLYGSIFISNYAQKISSVRCSWVSLLVVIQCFFQDNIALESPGLISIDSGVILITQFSKFIKNGANDGLVFSVTLNTMTGIYVSIEDIQISNCNSEGSLIKILSSKISISFKNVYINASQARIFDISDSIVFGVNVSISNLNYKSKEKPHIFNIDKGSNISLNSIKFANISCSLIYLQDSTLKMNGSSIEIFTSETKDALFYALNSEFIFTSSQVMLMNQSFLSSDKSGLTINETKLIRKNATDSIESASFLRCFECKNVLIINSLFDGNSVRSIRGAAFYFSSDTQNSNLTLINTNFTNNSAIEEGGAIYLAGCNLTVYKSIFFANRANRGGAIYSDIQVGSHNNLFIINSTFYQNYALKEGGALKFTSREPFLTQVTFVDNQAKIYGSNIAAFPIRINAEILSSLNKSAIFSLNQSTPLFSMENETSGKNLSYFMNFSLVDIYGATVATVDTKISVNVFRIAQVLRYDEEKENSASGSSEQLEVPKSIDIKGDTSINIQKGVFLAENIYIYADPPKISVTLKISTPEINKDLSELYTKNNLGPNEKYVNDAYVLLIPVSLRNCKRGEIYSKDIKACKECGYGKQSLDPNDSECKPCPLNAECFGRDNITVNKGYWRSSPNSTNLYKCDPFPEACLGGYDSKCKTGHIGPLCQSCFMSEDVQYYRSGVYDCEKCETSTALSLVQAIIIFSSIIFLLALLISANLSDLRALSRYSLTDEGSPEYILKNGKILNKVSQSIILKIFINYCQIISIARTLNLNWPEEVVAIFKIHEGAGGLVQLANNLASIECLSFVGDRSSVIYTRTVVISIFPFIVIFLIAGFWLFKYKVFQHTKAKTSFISSIVMLFLLIQPAEINIVSRLIACLELDDGHYYMVFELVQECYTEKHMKFVLFIFLPMVSLWGIILPCVLALILRKNKKELDNTLIRNRYGYLYYGYKINYYYWEFVIIVRKMALLFIVLFFQFNNTFKVLYILMILSFSLTLQISKKPYYTDDMNSLEAISIFSSIMTLFFALLYYLNDTKQLRTVLFSVVLLVNITFFSYFLNKIYLINKHYFLKCLRIICIKCFKPSKKGTRFSKAYQNVRDMIMSYNTLTPSSNKVKINCRIENNES